MADRRTARAGELASQATGLSSLATTKLFRNFFGKQSVSNLYSRSDPRSQAFFKALITNAKRHWHAGCYLWLAKLLFIAFHGIGIMKKLLLTAVFLGFSAVVAQAAPLLQITVQEGAGVVQSATGGNPLITNLTTTNFAVDVQIGLVDTAAPSIDLGSSILASGAGTLTVTLSVMDLTSVSDVNKWLSQFSGNWATPSTTVTLQTYIADNSKSVDTTTNALPSGAKLLSTLSGSASPFATSATSGITNTTGTFSLIEVLTVTTTGAGSISLDSSITRVPEPMSITLFGTALLGLGMVNRKRKKDVSAAA